MPDMRKWVASDYLDNGRYGILDESNGIIVGASKGLTAAQAREIAAVHNDSIDKLRELLTGDPKDPRPEGVYLKTEMYPSPDDPEARKLYIIERVAGNGTVERVTLTVAEMGDLKYLFKATV